MSIAIVADAHIGGPGGAVEPLLAQLGALPDQGAERVVLLDDLFQVWVGYGQCETLEVAAFLAVVDELRRRGLRVDYIEWNRDFFLAEGPYRTRFDSVGFEVALTHGQIRHFFSYTFATSRASIGAPTAWRDSNWARSSRSRFCASSN